MLVGNKCDLPNRQVSSEEAAEFAKSKGYSYMEVSAKTGQNVKNVFSMMVKEIHDKLNVDKNVGLSR